MAAGRLLVLTLAALLVRPLSAGAEEEQTFPLLQIGTRTYTNVTVTTKAKTYIFIFHAGGMNNIKVADLPAELREKLGYASEEKRKAGTNNPAGWAKAEVAKLETPQIKEIRQSLERRWHANKGSGQSLKALVSSRLVMAILGILALVHLFHSYCFMLICQKAGHPPGVLVWLPILQCFPLLRAAGMSGWWFVVNFFPLLNLTGFILWSVKIAKARGKSPWTALFMVLPLTSFLALMYLAFSTGAGGKEGQEEPEVMSLQTA